MNEFFNKYVDLTALALTVLLPFVITFRLKRKAGKLIRAVPVYFLVFGPAGILTFMFFHLFENSYHAVENSLNGTFVYNFRFYSLILLGLVMGYTGIRFLNACFGKCLQADFCNRQYFLQVGCILCLTVPLIPIIPIAFVPVFLCGVSLAGFPFVRRKKRATVPVFKEVERTQTREVPTFIP